MVRALVASTFKNVCIYSLCLNEKNKKFIKFHTFYIPKSLWFILYLFKKYFELYMTLYYILTIILLHEKKNTNFQININIFKISRYVYIIKKKKFEIKNYLLVKKSIGNKVLYLNAI